MSKKHKGGGHGGDVHADERWLITYADMITLLLAVFIVMYALSDTNLRKFNAFAQSLSSAFNTDVFSGTSQFTISAGVEVAPETGSQQSGVGFVSGQTSAFKAAIKDYAIEHGLGDKVSITEIDNGISLKITTDNLLFAAGRARLLDTELLGRISESLRGIPGVIEVRGHTDDQSPNGALFANNFELSVARAMAVMAFLREAGIDEGRMRIAGAAQYEPIVANDTEANRARNRYVEIRVQENVSASPSPTADSFLPTLEPVVTP
ncbi:MAG: flagellar motor protein MotB [Chloroflexota bacterium]